MLDINCGSPWQIRLEIKQNLGNFLFKAKIEQVVKVKLLKHLRKSVKLMQDKINNRFTNAKSFIDIREKIKRSSLF